METRACLLFVAIVAAVHTTVASDVFASTANIHKLFGLEKILASYIRLLVLDKMLDIARELEAAQGPVSEVEQTAADSFRVIQRMIETVDAVRGHLEPSTTSLEKFIEMRARLIPDESDLRGAATSLLRLQRTYNLTVPALFPNGTAHQYFIIGREAYSQSDFLTAADWFEHGIQAMPPGTVSNDTRDILDHLAFSYYRIGRVPDALEVSQQLLALFPNNSRVADNVEYYKMLLTSPAKAANGPTVVNSRNFTEDNLLKNTEEDFARFRSLCQGQVFYEPPEPLFCEYETYGNPALFWKPAKVEHLTFGSESLQILRDFATPEECAALRQVASDRLGRSVASTGSQFEPVNFRISTVAWLEDGVSEVVARLNKRISQWTNLDVEHAEQLQVSNYGVGGHYEPHFDFFGERRKKDVASGDRLATFMIYLTNVAKGGATAFPRLGARSFPSLGDAAFWFNLESSLETDELTGNYNTLHGACPVILGSKWVANKWIHEAGNAF